MRAEGEQETNNTFAVKASIRIVSDLDELRHRYTIHEIHTGELQRSGVGVSLRVP